MAEEKDAPVQEEPKAPSLPVATPDFLLFGKWDSTVVQVKDVGLTRYISLKSVLIPHTAGRHSHKRFHKSKSDESSRLSISELASIQSKFS
jgi:small subunit ribosomal protein S7